MIHTWGGGYEWEKSKLIKVFSFDNGLNAKRKFVISTISNLFKKYNIGLVIEDGNSCKNDFGLMRNIFNLSVDKNKIDFDKLLEFVRVQREQNILTYAICIITNSGYSYKEYNGEQPYWGCSDFEGLTVITKLEEKVIIHEFAHLIGLAYHHDNDFDCIMTYNCNKKYFCSLCEKRLYDIQNVGFKVYSALL